MRTRQTLLGTSELTTKELFEFGPADQLDAVSCTGQVVILPQGQFSTLTLLGTGVEGDQLGPALDGEVHGRDEFHILSELQ